MTLRSKPACTRISNGARALRAPADGSAIRTPMPRSPRDTARPPAHAFTLIELLAVMIIISTVGVVTSGILMSASQMYTTSAAHRRAAENVALALDRVVRVLREAPAKPTPAGAANISSATATTITLSDGNAIALSGNTLNLSSATVSNAPLCKDVTAFQITYLDGAGTVVDLSSGTDTVRRVHIRLAAGGTELRTSTWLRAGLNE